MRSAHCRLSAALLLLSGCRSARETQPAQASAAPAHDAGPTDASTRAADAAVRHGPVVDAQAAGGEMPIAYDAEAFWTALCTGADRCGWLGGDGHPELEFDRATCLERHSADRLPSSDLAYLTGLEHCVLQAEGESDCTALEACYRRHDLKVLVCTELMRCADITATECDAELFSLPTRTATKLDSACAFYCLESIACGVACGELGAEPSCAAVLDCATACT